VAACQWTRVPHLYHISCSYLSNSFLQILGRQSAEPHNSLSSVSHNLLGALIQLVMFSSWSGSPNWTRICCYRLSIIVGVHNSCFRLGKALQEFPPFGASFGHAYEGRDYGRMKILYHFQDCSPGATLKCEFIFWELHGTFVF